MKFADPDPAEPLPSPPTLPDATGSRRIGESVVCLALVEMSTQERFRPEELSWDTEPG